PANPLMNLPLDRKTPLRTVRSDGAKLRFHSGACRQTRSRRALQIVEYFSSRRCEAERLFLAHSKDEAPPGTLRGTKDCRSHAAPQREPFARSSGPAKKSPVRCFGNCSLRRTATSSS